MHLRHHSHARAWRSLARPTRRPAARAHASLSCSPVSVCTLANLADRFLRFRAGRQARAVQRVARRRAGGLQPAMRLRSWGSPSICARASRWQGWASFRTSRLPRSTHCWPTPRPTLVIFVVCWYTCWRVGTRTRPPAPPPIPVAFFVLPRASGQQLGDMHVGKLATGFETGPRVPTVSKSMLASVLGNTAAVIASTDVDWMRASSQIKD